MKKIVLHGDDTVKAHSRLQKFIDSAKKRSWEIVRIQAGKDKIEDSIRSNTLFGNTRLFVIEDPEKLTDDEAGWIKNKNNIEETIVFFAKSTLGKTFTQKIGGVDTIELFEIPPNIWKCIDSFSPHNSKVFLRLLGETIETEPIEFVFALLSREVRDMYHVLQDPSTLKSAPWRVKKLESKAQKFGREKLVRIISAMSEMDIKAKTSKANLRESLDFLVLRELE